MGFRRAVFSMNSTGMKIGLIFAGAGSAPGSSSEPDAAFWFLAPTPTASGPKPIQPLGNERFTAVTDA